MPSLNVWRCTLGHERITRNGVTAHWGYIGESMRVHVHYSYMIHEMTDTYEHVVCRRLATSGARSVHVWSMTQRPSMTTLELESTSFISHMDCAASEKTGLQRCVQCPLEKTTAIKKYRILLISATVAGGKDG